jgi:hypothetical protein
VSPGLRQNETALIRIVAGNLGVRALHDQTVQRAHVHLGERCSATRELAHITDGVVMIDRLHVILERLAADRDALLDDQRGFGCRQRVPLDRVRRVGQFKIMDMLKVAQPPGCQGLRESIQFGLLRGDLLQKFVHDSF